MFAKIMGGGVSGMVDQNDQPFGLAQVVQRMNPEYHSRVVKQVLGAERQLSETVAQTLRLWVRGIPVKGHRPGNGPLRLYHSHLTKVSWLVDQPAEAVLQGWVETHGDMRDLVVNHMGNCALLDGEFDPTKLSVAISRWDKAWDDALDQLIEQNSSLGEDDLTLMTFLVGGQMPPPGEEESPMTDSDKPEVPPLFEGMFRTLSELPLDGSEWSYLSAHFMEATNRLRTNLEQRAIGAAAKEEIARLATDLLESNADALMFLEIDGLQRLSPPAAGWADPLAARGQLARLGELLAEYDIARRIAQTRSEEEARRPHRIELEQQIDDTLSAIDGLEATRLEEGPSAVGAATEAPLILFGTELTELLTAVQRLKSENAVLLSERDQLAIERDGLASERDALTDTVKSLEEDLDENRDNSEVWRKLYQLSHIAQEEVSSAEERPTAQSVAHSKQLAEERFSGRLEFRLIAKSDLDIPFDKPQQVYDALEWLATTYHESKTSPAGTIDLDFSLKETCGWRYTRQQSNVTMGQFPEYYEIVVDGRKYKLEEHIGTGNGYARGTIRVAFYWHGDRGKVVVGYIGRHQRTTAT